MVLLWAQAHAFCGTFVSSSGDLFNSASEIAIVREGQRTTLTMANDFDGDPEEFAMLVPVPVVLGEDDVRVVDPLVFDRMRAYSAPRLVSYTCDELYPDPPERGQSFDVGLFQGGCADYALQSKGVADTAGGYGGTQIEAQFIVGEYEIVVLSSQESTGLLSWLGDNGYQVADETADLLQDYIDDGSYFFAAKVFVDRIPSGQPDLSPLQFSYESEGFSLPIRLGTVNSSGSQDLVVYAVTPLDDGRVGISNYEEREVEALCLVEGDNFGALYTERFRSAVEGDGDDDANWVTEYGWAIKNTATKCDPCPPGVDPTQPIPASDIVTLGFDFDGGGGDSGWWGSTPEFYFTRLHIRYTPEQATDDLALYVSGLQDNTQYRYVQYEEYLEIEWPICGEGFVDDPGSCADVDSKYGRRIRKAHNEAEGGCAVNAGPEGAGLALLAGFVSLLASIRRR